MRSSGRGALVLTLTAALLSSAGAASAQSLQQQNEQILNELKAIRALLEKLAGPLAQPPAGTDPAAATASADDQVALPVAAGPALGLPDAPLTMVEYTDLQCPFCRQFHVTVFERIKKEYIDTGKLRYISRDYPIETIHPHARAAARAARCANEQGKFWEMRHAILTNNTKLNATAFAGFAQELKLDIGAYKACEATAVTTYQAEMQKDLADATAAGVTATPTFIIGRTAAVIEGVRLVGAQPFAVYDAKIKELLAKLATP